LEVLHGKEIIHRDLKPSNIMLVPLRNGGTRAVVMDFGLARPVQNNPEMFETRTDLQAGAPYFMAPELLMGERPSIASDVYAFGLLIDEMVTRSRAYTAQSLHLLLFQKLREQPEAPSKRADHLPAGWERVILTCLDPVPENRFASVGEVLWALENPQAEGALVAPRRFTRRKLALAAASVPVLTAGVVIANLALKPLSAGMIVFPVANETGRKDFDYICKITDSELLRRLSGVPGLGAVAYYAPRPAAARKLDTRFILEGRLTAVANGYEMVLTLTDNSNGQAFWTHEFDPFDRPGSLDLQTEVTQRVIEEIDNYSTFGPKNTVTARVAPIITPLRKWFGAEPTRIPGTTTMSGDAWEQYSQAHQLLDKDSESSVRAGIDLLKKATAIDSNFALGFAALSRGYILLATKVGHDSQRALDDAENYALKSLACDRQLAEPHVFLAAVQQNRWEWTESINNFNRAIQLRPRFPQALRWFGGLLVQFGQFQEGLKHSAHAIEIDPYGIPNYLCHGMYLFFARRCEEAIRLYTTHLDGGDQAMLGNLAECHAWMGHKSSGQTRERWFQLANHAAQEMEDQERQEAVQSGAAPSTDGSLVRALVHALSGDIANAQPYIARLEQSMDAGTTSPADVAKCYSALGDQKTAVELLERAYVVKDPELMFIKVDPLFDSVQSNPQVRNIIRAMKLA
jgi:serine/threonine-protein kinase